MAVPVHRHVEPVDGAADEVSGGLGGRNPDRVDDDRLLGPRFDRGFVCALEEAKLGARAVDAEEGDRDPLRRREGDGLADPAEHVVVRDAQRRELRVRDRALDDRRAHPQLGEQLDVRLHGAREAPDLGSQAGVCDQPDRLRVLGGDARETCLDPVDARFVKGASDRELVLRREHDADRLLAVAKGRVVQADRGVRLRLERALIQLARPELVAIEGHARTIPSGKRQSRSGPLSVIRKLSSTRRPPPSGQ